MLGKAFSAITNFPNTSNIVTVLTRIITRDENQETTALTFNKSGVSCVALEDSYIFQK